MRGQGLNGGAPSQHGGDPPVGKTLSVNLIKPIASKQ